jgi:hypothetical protein
MIRKAHLLASLDAAIATAALNNVKERIRKYLNTQFFI